MVPMGVAEFPPRKPPAMEEVVKTTSPSETSG